MVSHFLFETFKSQQLCGIFVRTAPDLQNELRGHNSNPAGGVLPS